MIPTEDLFSSEPHLHHSECEQLSFINSTLTHTHTVTVRGVRGQMERRGIPDKLVAWPRARSEEWLLCRAFTTLCGVTKQSLPFSRLSKTPLWCEERVFISHTHIPQMPTPPVYTYTHTNTHTLLKISACVIYTQQPLYEVHLPIKR